MVTEEIGLNRALEEHGFKPLETDVGEYILQLADEIIKGMYQRLDGHKGPLATGPSSEPLLYPGQPSLGF